MKFMSSLRSDMCLKGHFSACLVYGDSLISNWKQQW